MDKHPILSQVELQPMCDVQQDVDAIMAPQLPGLSTSCDVHAGGEACTDDRDLTASPDLGDSSPFSIRGYVAAVRDIDITRCWPFSSKLLEESIQEGKDLLLPPLTGVRCPVRIHREYYQGGAYTDMDVACDVNDGPQLQVQIDLSKCEPDGQVACNPGEPPADKEALEACSPNNKLADKHDTNPFLDSAFISKRQAPRSIREIRKSVMQGCQCFKRMGNAVCTKDNCSNSQNLVSMNTGKDTHTIDGSTLKSRDEMGGAQKIQVDNIGNVSAITELDCCRKVGGGKDYDMKSQISHENRGPNIIIRSPKAAHGADGQLIPSSDMLESRVIAKRTPPTLGAVKELPSYASSKSKTQIECSPDSQSADKSIESQNSKSLTSRPRFDSVMQQDTFDTMAGSDNIPQQRCPVCLLFQCSSNTALNAHIDRCLVASSTEATDNCKEKLQRGKVRKKRSMAELCQVAPPCGSARELPPHSTSVPSSKVKESTATECLSRKRTKLLPQGLDKATTQLERNRKLIKSQAQALQFIQWRSRSAAASRDLQIPLGATRRSALHEARLGQLNKSILRSRNLELNASSTLIKKHWKRQKLNHEREISKHEAHKIKKRMQREKKKCTQGRFLNILPQTNLQASNEFRSRVGQKDKQLAASNSLLPQKRKPSKQSTHVQASDTVVTVEGSHKTTFEFLRPDDGVNEELNQPKKVHFRVHVKPAKKPNKQRTTADLPQSLNNTECTTSILSKSSNDTPNQTNLSEVGKAFEPAGSAQANHAKEGNSSSKNLRRLAEEGLIADPLLPPRLVSLMLDHQAQVRMPPVTRHLQTVSNETSTTTLLHGHIPSTSDGVRSRTEDTTKFFTNGDNVSPLSHERQPKDLRDHSAACAAQAWQSLLKKTRQDQLRDPQQPQASLLLSRELPHRRGASMQFPFSLCADDLSGWPRDSERADFLMTSSSERASSCRPAYPFRPEHVAKLAQMLGASNRCRDFAARQEHALMNEAGIHFSIQPDTTRQLNQGSHTQTNHLATQNSGFQMDSQREALQAQNDPQRLPAWMQAAILEQRPSAMPSVDCHLPTDPVGQSIVLNTTPHASREVCRPSSTLNMVGNPVLRLMGKTMVLMPESHQNQVDLTTSHFNGPSNYINFFQSLDVGEAGHKQQWNVERVQSSAAPEAMASQDYICNNGVHSWINSSAPQLQDFFLQMSSSSPTGNLPVAHQQVTPHVMQRNMPAQDVNSQWLHLRSSPVASGILPGTHRNWQQCRKVQNTAFFQPRSSLFCQRDKAVPSPPFCEEEIPSSFRSSWKQKHSTAYKGTNSVQNLTPEYLRTATASPLPCWLSSINRVDQPATVIVLDEEGPLCSFETSSSEALGEKVRMSSRPADQQTRQNPWPQTRANISDACHSRRARHKSKTFIPIIYTVGNNLGDSNGTPRTTVAKFPEATGDYQYRGADHRRGVNNSSQRRSCIEQPGGRSRIVYTSGGGSPANATRVNADSHSVSGSSKLDRALKHTASVEVLQAAAERTKTFPTRGANSALETSVSRKPCNPSQQTDVQTSAAVESQTPTMGMCSVNMNPAEVDCQDAGQFMSTPTLIPSFQAMPPHNGGRECMDKSSIMHSSSQAQGLSSSSKTSLTTEKIDNASLPAISPSGLYSETSYQDRVLGSSNAKACATESTNACFTLNFSQNASTCGDLSGMATINTPSSANLMASSHSDDTGTLQNYANSRMQPLKVAGKFKIVNGRISMIQKETHENMANAAANGKQLGSTHASTVDVQHHNTEVVERAYGRLMIVETHPAGQ